MGRGPGSQQFEFIPQVFCWRQLVWICDLNDGPGRSMAADSEGTAKARGSVDAATAQKERMRA